MQSLVSVIITCLNCTKFLSKAVDCVLSQTYENIECIIVDDGSTDDTRSLAELLAQKDERIKYVFNTGKHSPASARNFGLKHASGEWIQFYDVDDYLYPDKLKKQLDYLIDNNIDTQQPLVLYSDFEATWENEDGECIKKITNIIGHHSRDGLLNKVMSWHEGPTMPLHVNSTLFKRTVFDKKLFNADLIIFEEVEFFIDLIYNNIPFIYIPTIAMTYRTHSTNLTKDYRRSTLGYIQFLNEVYNKDPSLLIPTSERINIIMTRLMSEGDSEVFNNLIAIIKRAHIPFSYPWKGINVNNAILLSILFRLKKISRFFHQFFSSKNA